jgi:hypothetical protein
MSIIVKRMIYSNFYIYYYFIMIIFNMFQVLLLFRPWTGEVHLDLHPSSTAPWERTSFIALEAIISLCLIAEVALKLSWYRWDFFYGSDCYANVLDLLLAFACGAILVMTTAGVWDGGLEQQIETTSLDSEALITLTLAVILRVVMRIVRLVPAAKHWRRIRDLSSPESQVRFGSFLLGEEMGEERARNAEMGGRWMDASTASNSSWWDGEEGGDGETIPCT